MITHQKGLNLFLEIIKELDLKNKNKFNYLIVGKIKDKEKIFDLNLKGKVTILNFNNFVKDLIQVSDIIIFPSNNEGFGRVLIEAMLLKTHFIASNSVRKELVIHAQNGFVSQKNSSKEYIKLI